MWSAKETMRALREERAMIQRAWQTEAQTRLWHLDEKLLTRRGAASLCASAALTVLTEYHQVRAAAPDSLPALRSAANAHAPAGERSEAADWDSLFASCIQEWAALPVSWADARVLLGILAAQTRSALTLRDADKDTLALGEAVFDAIAAAVADQRVSQLEKQLATQHEEALTTHHLAGRFLANASHEIRTPLTAVLGFAELLLEETYGSLTGEQRTVIGHIENSAQNLLEIINNLLDLLRIRTGKLDLQFRPTEITPILRHLYDVLSPLAERKKVTFTMDLSQALGVIEADENILHHIIYHLLASSLRATPAGGSVTLSATRDDATLTIATCDTALYLPPEAVANMATPFPRLENSPARGYEGWEVGLPLVRRYVDMHNGEIKMESFPSRGTTFWILLPVTQTAKTP